MFTPLPHHRFRFSDREARMIFEDRAPDLAPGVGLINGFVERITKGVRGLLSPDQKQAKETQARLNNATEWLTAFQSATVFTDPVLDRATLANRAFGPEDVIKTMTIAQREDAFIDFIETIIPSSAVATDVAALRKAMAEPDAKLRAAAVAPIQAKLTGASRIMLGVDLVPDPTTATAILARNGFRARYADIATGSFGVIHNDYLEAVRFIRARRGPAVAIRPEDLGSRKFLTDQLSQIRMERPSRFLGWLLTEDNAEVERVLKILAAERRLQDLDEDQSKLKVKIALDRVQKGPAEQAERESRSFIDNFNMMEPWQQYAVVGLGLFAAYKMFTSKNILVRSIPVAVLGTYLYLRLMNGDQNAFTTMTGNVQGFGKIIRDAARNTFRGGVLPESVEDQDIARMLLMSRFMKQKAGLDLENRVMPMVCALGVKGRHFVGEAFTVQMSGDDIQYNFFASLGTREQPTSPFAAEMMGEARRRNYDVEQLQKEWFMHAPRIAQGMAAVFFEVAAREDPAAAKPIQEARLKSGTFGGTFNSITDRTMKQRAVDLMNRGRLIISTQNPWKNMKMGDIVGTLMTERSERVIRPDTAERVSIKTLTAGPRSADYGANGLLAPNALNVTASGERTAAIDRVKESFRQFLSNARGPAPHRLINEEAHKEINAAFNRLMDENPNRPLTDMVRAVEQLKYTILVAALRSPARPMDVITVRDGIIRPLERGGNFFGTLIGGTLGFLNNEFLTINSGFGQVQNLSSVRAMLAERAGSGPVSLNARGFLRLQREMDEYVKLFAAMRDGLGGLSTAQRRRVAEQMAKNLPDSIRRRCQAINREPVDVVLSILNHNDPGHNGRIANMEQFFAQRCANGLALAMLTSHRSNGNHAIDSMSDWSITPIEQDNLVEEWSHDFTALVGISTNPHSGVWGRLEATDATERELRTPSDPATEVGGGQTQSRVLINQVTTLTRAHLWLYRGTDPVPEHMGIRTRVVAIATAFADKWEAEPSDDARRTLRDRNSAFSVESQRLVLHALILLGADLAIINRIRAIADFESTEEFKKKAEFLKRTEETVKKSETGIKTLEESIEKLSAAPADIKKSVAELKAKVEEAQTAVKAVTDAQVKYQAELKNKAATDATIKTAAEAVTKATQELTAKMQADAMVKFEQSQKQLTDKIRKLIAQEALKFVEGHMKTIEAPIKNLQAQAPVLQAQSILVAAAVQALAKTAPGDAILKPVEAQLKLAQASMKRIQDLGAQLDKQMAQAQEAIVKAGTDAAAIKVVRDRIRQVEVTITAIEKEAAALQKQAAAFRNVLAAAEKAGAPAAVITPITDAVTANEASVKAVRAQIVIIQADQKLLTQRLNKLGL